MGPEVRPVRYTTGGAAARVRRAVGWVVIVLGVILMPLPGPGVLIVAAGIAILGRNDPLLRRVALLLRLGLRRLSRSRQPLLRRSGRLLYYHHSAARRTIRNRAAGQPLPWAVWVVLGLSVVGMIVSLLLATGVLHR